MQKITQKNQIIEHIERFIELSEPLECELTKRIGRVSFRKGELVHDAKRISNKSYFITEGLLRIYFIKDGKEVSEHFFSENEWANSPRSWRKRETDCYYIDAIEDTVALSLKASDLNYLFDHFPEMNRYGRLSMVHLLDYLMERIESLRFTDAKEKYQHFKRIYSAIHHRIPLGMVASHLGIAQETLSRVRAEK